MKQPEYVEGPEALKNFEQGMIALFKVPKAKDAKDQKKQAKKSASQEKSQKSGRD